MLSNRPSQADSCQSDELIVDTNSIVSIEASCTGGQQNTPHLVPDRLETNRSKSELSISKPVTQTGQTGCTSVTSIYTKPVRPVGHTGQTGMNSQIRPVHTGKVQTLKFLDIHARKTKGGEGRDKLKGKKPKVTFNELLAKYIKMRDAKSANRPKDVKRPRLTLKYKSGSWDLQGSKFHSVCPNSPISPVMPISYRPPSVSFHPYSSWRWHGTWTPPLSYSRPYHSTAPRKPNFGGQPHVRDRFNQKDRSRAQEKKKVVKQVYRVKKDNRKDKSSDLNSNDEKSNVTIETSANIGKDVKQQVVDKQGAKYEPKKLEVIKFKQKLPMSKSEVQPRHPLGLSNWQLRNLQKLSTEELKEKNMAWVPKGSAQVHGEADNQMKGVKKTNRRRATNSHLRSQRFASNHQEYQFFHHLYSLPVPQMQIPWNAPSGMFGYPSWPYFDLWMSYGSLYHGGLFPNYYMFE